MKTISLTPEVEALARRLVWFEPPGQAIRNTARFLAYVFTYGTHVDMETIRQQLNDDDLREALALAPPGIIDPRSWSYWNLKFGKYPPPPMPQRQFQNASAK